MDRRAFLSTTLTGLALAPIAARAQAPAPQFPPAAARDWTRGDPIRYPDPDIVALDPRFRRYMVGNTIIKRLHTGTLWAEGPAWNGVGRYLVWSDIPNNVQMRWIEEDGRVTVFRNPSGYSNGNTFDYEGRQLSCEHGGRRVVRYEVNGTVTVIAEKFQGKRLNSPNDIAVHPDGGIWFTDPTYGIRGNYEGFKGESEIKEAVYRVDPKTLQIEKVTDELGQPNGLCFSPDYKKVYIADTGHRARHPRLRHRRQGAAQRQAVRRSSTYPATGAPSARRRHPLRCRRQHLGRRAARRAGDRARRRADRDDSAAGDLRQRVLRRHEAQSPVHGRQPVALRRSTSRPRALTSPDAHLPHHHPRAGRNDGRAAVHRHGASTRSSPIC